MQKKVQRVDGATATESGGTSDTSQTEADRIWSEIKDKKIDMFSLPSQVVSQYCKPVAIDPSKLYLLLTATSVLPALETSLGENYVVDRVERFVTVSRKLKPAF